MTTQGVPGAPVFEQHDIATEEIDRLEQVNGALGDALRALTEATIRTEVDDDVLRWATERLAEVTDRLSEQAMPGPFGVHFNHEGRSWQWGNAVAGLRNPVAPPVQFVREDELVWAEVDLGVRYEGPPGYVHGGVSALLLDHLMGVVAASGKKQPTMTGTLTLRYRRLTPIGPVRLEGRVTGQEGRKVFVSASIGDTDGVTVEAEGIFIIPRWAD